MATSNDKAEKPEATATSTSAEPASGFLKPLQPSQELAAVVGSAPLPRPEVVSKVWGYIEKHKLQNPQNRREIMADEKLQAVFGGRNKVSMFEMNKYLAQHLTCPPGAASDASSHQGRTERCITRRLLVSTQRLAGGRGVRLGAGNEQQI
jgi:chromatin remodeling complex protein RSC6